jgi:hypothetical protein
MCLVSKRIECEISINKNGRKTREIEHWEIVGKDEKGRTHDPARVNRPPPPTPPRVKAAGTRDAKVNGRRAPPPPAPPPKLILAWSVLDVCRERVA